MFKVTFNGVVGDLITHCTHCIIRALLVEGEMTLLQSKDSGGRDVLHYCSQSTLFLCLAGKASYEHGVEYVCAVNSLMVLG